MDLSTEALCRHIPNMTGRRFDAGVAYARCIRCRRQLVQLVGRGWQVNEGE